MKKHQEIVQKEKEKQESENFEKNLIQRLKEKIYEKKLERKKQKQQKKQQIEDLKKQKLEDVSLNLKDVKEQKWLDEILNFKKYIDNNELITKKLYISDTGKIYDSGGWIYNNKKGMILGINSGISKNNENIYIENRILILIERKDTIIYATINIPENIQKNEFNNNDWDKLIVEKYEFLCKKIEDIILPSSDGFSLFKSEDNSGRSLVHRGLFANSTDFIHMW